MSPASAQDDKGSTRWAPDAALDPAELQFIELLAIEQPDLGGFRTQVAEGLAEVADFGSVTAVRCAERAQRAFDAGLWQVAEGGFALALRAECRGSGALCDAAVDLACRLAVTHRIRGRLPLAHELQQALLDHRRERLGPEHLQTLAVELQLAETLLLQGRFAQAKALQEQVLEGRRRALGDDHGDTAEAMQDLGATLCAEGHLVAAAELLRTAVDIRRRAQGPEAPATTNAENGYAAVLWAQGDYAGARALQEHVLEVAARVGSNDRELLTFQGNLATTLHKLGELTQAEALHERVLEGRARRFGNLHLDTLTAKSNLAWTLHALGELERAGQLAQEVVDTSRQLLGAAHPLTFSAEGALVQTLRAQGDDLRLRGMAIEGLASMPTAATSIGNVSKRYVFLLRALESQCSAAVAREGSCAAQVDWIADLLERLPSISVAFREALEWCHVDERRASLVDYVEFHAAWVAICIGLAPQRLPQALAPLHGMESWSALLTRLHEAEPAPRSGPQSALQQARHALVQLRLRQATLASMIDSAVRQIADLEALLRAAPDGGGDPGADPTRRTAAHAQVLAGLRRELDGHAASLAALRAEEDQAIRRYRHARSELAHEDPTLAALLAMPALTSADLAARLRPGEALLITVALPTQRVAVVVIRPKATALVEVAGLASIGELAARYQSGRRALMRGAGLRDGILPLRGAPPAVDADPIPTARVVDAVHAAFWQPLAHALAGVQRVHLVTGPGQHSLPLECGAPRGLPVHRCFGLPAYLSVHDRPLPLPPATPGLDIVADPAWSRTPIPFVEAEAELVRTSASARGRVRRVPAGRLFGRRSDARRLLLCVHGGVAGEAGREHGYLVLDAAAEPVLTLDPPRVGDLPAAIAEVYASACLGAVVGSNDTGSALGLCSEWQLRGVSSVIACLVPVEDHFMPLLAALFWQRRWQGQVPYQALEGAKAELRSGDWPEALIEPLRRAYAKTMRAVLERAAYREGEPGARRAAQTIGGWLLPPYVRSSWFETRGLDDATHREFSAACCESAAGRERLVAQCLAYLIDERARPEDLAVLPFARAAIDNICAFTHCFGSGGVGEETEDAP